MDEIVSIGIVCDRCGELLVENGVIVQGYVILGVIGDPDTKNYLCAMCDEEWRSYYLMVNWQVEKELLTIEPN